MDLTDIKHVVIGIGDRDVSGSFARGEVSFDDIRLYKSRCIPESGPAADFTNDCIVDYKDVETMNFNWLNTAVAPPDGNLVGYWQFENNTNDSSTNDNDGTLAGNAGYGPGKIGRALALDGVEDYMTVGNDSVFNFTGPFTLAAWVKSTWPRINPTKSQVVIGKGPATYRLYTRINSDNVQFTVTGLDVNDPKPDATEPENSVSGDMNGADGQWHHVAGVYDGSNLYVYADGIPTVLDINDACSPSTDSNEVWFGYYDKADTHREWQGYIDEVRIYNYALSEAEIDYLAGLPTDLSGDDKVNFKDFAELGNAWLDQQWWP